MRRTYPTADYEIKQGRFLILSTLDGNKYTEVAADFLDGSDENYLIYEGFIIVDSTNSLECAEVLYVKNREEANGALARFLDDLDAY